jgi:hypothetical protein
VDLERQAEALTQPAVRETQAAYAASQANETLPYDPAKGLWGRPSKEQIAAIMESSRAKSPKPFTVEEAEAWLARVRKLREKVVAEFGPTDVTELLRDIRGDED